MSVEYSPADGRHLLRRAATRELCHIESGGGDDRAAVVDMRAGRQPAAPVQISHVRAQLFVDVAVVFLRPDLPVGQRSISICLLALADDQLLTVGGDLAQSRAHAEPVSHAALLVGTDGAQVESDGAVDGTLLDRILTQHAVLGVNPSSCEPIALFAVGPRADPEGGVTLAPDEEVPVRFVGDHPAVTWVVKHRVADIGAFDEPVVMKEDATHLEAGR